ncbi:MAG: HNH endonuclease family protein, partial [Pseudomonadota bacterium]
IDADGIVANLNGQDFVNKGKLQDIEWAAEQLSDTDCYDNWQEELRYLLYRYEEYLCQRKGHKYESEQWQRIWETSAAKSIEHVRPQSKPKGMKNVSRLGNLILLPPGLNSSLHSRAPKAKSMEYRQSGLLMAVETAERIESDGEWTVAKMQQREKEIIDWVRMTWGATAQQS